VKKQTVPVLAAGALAVVAWTTASHAQGGVTAPPEVNPEVARPIVYTHPNNAILGTGIFTFLGSYVPSVLVGVVNDNSYDRRLYLPIVGPWVDLAERPGCGGPGQTTCPTETAFKTMLIVAGAVQGLGGVLTTLGLALPERQVTLPPAKAQAPTLHVLPAAVGRGYGMEANGTF
jgi:hypothetical protein